MFDKIIAKFDSDAQLGLLQCRRRNKFLPFEYVDIDHRSHSYFTDCGFFFRRLDELLVFPEDALDNLGAGEEQVIGHIIASRGYSAKLYLKSDINHLLNYGGLRNFEWMKQEVTNSELGNLTYVKNIKKKEEL